MEATPQFASPAMGDLVRRIAEAVRRRGGRAWLVGGAARDALLGLAPQDVDLEVYHLGAEELERLLQEFGRVHLVGRQFAVLHLATEHGKIEVSLPRRESKTGPGHRGFEVTAVPDLDPREAARRRDFTVNALMQDPLTGERLDPWGGLADLRAGVLRHVSPAFAEDSLRVLRVARFVARFGWRVDPATAALCRTLDLGDLPRERLEGEWRQVLLRGARPGLGLLALESVGALRFFPELAALRNVPQDPVWHPEGDVFHHTCLCLDAAVQLRGEMENPWVEMLAVLCHDLGKPATTLLEGGRWRSNNHDKSGEEPTRRFLARITRQQDVVDRVVDLVREHLRPMQLFQARERVSDAAVRRLSLRVDIAALVRVALADGSGRDAPFQRHWAPGEWLMQRAARLGVEEGRPAAFLQGRDLLALGMQPGKAVGELLAEAYHLQIEGALNTREEALEWAARRLASA